MGNKKKFTTILLSVLLAAFTLFGLVACGSETAECSHEWGEWSVASQATCDAVGTQERKCEKCEKTETETIAALGHTYGEWIAEIPATCVANGTKGHYHCGLCQKDFDAEYNVLTDLTVVSDGHNYDQTQWGYISEEGHAHKCYGCDAHDEIVAHTMSEATCNSKATCSGCGYSMGEVDASKHAYEHVEELDVVGDCKTLGSQTFVCSNCQDSYTVTDSELKGHSWTVEEVVADCKQGGYKVKTCTVCSTSERYDEVPAGVCSEIYTVREEATCQKDGEGVYKCTGCGEERTVVIAKWEHIYEGTVIAPTCMEGGYTLHECACGASFIDNLTESLGGHAWIKDEANCVAPSCNDKGIHAEKCNNAGCSETREEEISANGHSWVEPTCTAAGYCSVCTVKGEPALNHDSVLDETKCVAPTCTEDGYLFYACSRCDYTKTEVPASHKATGHNEEAIEWTEELVAVEGKACTYVNVKKGVCECGIMVEYRGEEKVQHLHTAAITKEATCTTKGEKTYTCKCGDSYIEKYEEVDAHKWNDGVTANGITTYTCQYNDTHMTTKVAVQSGDAISSEVLNAAKEVDLGNATLILDDKIKNEQVGTEDVALSAGILDGEELETATSKLSQEELALLGDSKIYNFTMTIGETPTTEFNGLITVRIPYTLTSEDDVNDIIIWYIDGETPTLISAKYVEIDGVGYAEFQTNHFSYYTVTKLSPAQRCEIYGHSWNVTQVNATCLSGGYTMQICRRCGKKEVTDKVAALGHNWALDEATAREVTCETDGYQKHACQRCQVSYEVKANALGHNWYLDVENSVIATCATAGTNVYLCDNENCAHTYATTTAKLAHTYVSTVTEPTCTKMGYTTQTCEVCSHTIVTDYVNATGHSIVSEVHQPTCLDKGYTENYCEKCGEVFERTDEKEKTDHEWDREEPDCENDKVCKYCRERHEHGKKTGHVMKNGCCEKCHKECNHTWKYSHDVEPTCSEKGHKVYKCKHCDLTEKRDEGDFAAHRYRFKEKVDATCQSPAYKLEICHDCGHENKIYEGEVAAHNFVDGICTMCGLSSDLLYYNIADSWANADGFAIKLENLAIVEFEREEEEGTWEILGQITQADFTELMLYVDEEGKLQGAGRGTITILNGPVPGNATYAVKALIEDEKVYMIVQYTTPLSSKEMSVTLSVEYLLGSILDEFFNLEGDGAYEGFMDYLEGDFAPVLESLINENANDINDFLGSLLHVILTSESTAEGYVFSLDYAKVSQINVDLGGITAAEFVDKYFGEGFFTSVEDFLREVLAVEIPEIPTYLEEKGVSKTSFQAIVNNFAALYDEEVDVMEFLADEEYEGITIGEWLFDDEDYEETFNEYVSELKSTSIYGLFLEEEAEEEDEKSEVEKVQEEVEEIISLLKDSLSLTMTTDLAGNVLSLQIAVNQFSYEDKYDRYDVNYSLTIVPNGKIEVTWSDIVGEIKGDTLLPDREDQVVGGPWRDYEHLDGQMEYKGVTYYYDGMEYYVEQKVLYYSNPEIILIYDDCGDWKKLDQSYRYVYEVSVPYQMLTLYDGNNVDEDGDPIPVYYLLVNTATNEIVEVTLTEDGLTYVRADGTTGSVSDEAIYDFVDVFKAVFGEMMWEEIYSYIRMYDDYEVYDEYYYNIKTGEISTESPHDYVYNEEYSYAPTGCYEYGLSVYVCTLCGDVEEEYYEQYHNYEYVYSLNENSTVCADGLDCTRMCTLCGEVFWVEQNARYGHVYANTYTYENGVITCASACSVCNAAGNVGQYATVVTEETLTLAEPRSDMDIAFAFTPTQTAVYEFYSSNRYNSDPYGYIYDSNWRRIISDDDGALNMHFGITLEMEAGKTYYLCARNIEGATLNLRAQPQALVIDLSAYGCGCGGTMTITSTYQEVRARIETTCSMTYESEYNSGYYHCEICGFGYYSEAGNTKDENCNVLYVDTYYFYNVVTEQEYSYEINRYKTGEVNHGRGSAHESMPTYEETTDENGNYVRIETYVESAWCGDCGKETYKYVRVRHYNENNSCIYYKNEEYAWDYVSSELYLSDVTETAYVYLANQEGEILRMMASEKTTDYNQNGDVAYWYMYEYEYSDILCCSTRTYTNSSGERTVEDYVKHLSKNYQNETNTTEGVDENGNPITITTYTEMRVCEECGMLTWKQERVRIYNAIGNEIQTEDREYNVINGTAYLMYTYCYTYDYVEYNGQYYSYTISDIDTYYNENGEITSLYGYRYEYADDCSYVRYSITEDGESESDTGTRHRYTVNEYVLKDGATSCEQGVVYRSICYACGAIEILDEYDTASHDYQDGYVYEDGVVSRQNTCQVCGLVGGEKVKCFDFVTTETLTVTKKNDSYNNYAYFLWKPSQTATYEIYSYGQYLGDPYLYIYDANWNRVGSNDDGAEGYNFGLLFETTANNTYYLGIRAEGELDVHLNVYAENSETVDLNEYGCACGGTMTITTRFGEQIADIQTNCGITSYSTCATCGFRYYSNSRYEADENCNEIYVRYYILRNNKTGVSYEYVIGTRLTGGSRHTTDYDSSYETAEGVDVNGNPIVIVTDTRWETCSVCGNVTEKDVYVYHYLMDETISYEEHSAYRWSTEDSALYMSYKETSKYVQIIASNGETRIKTVSSTETYYDVDGTLGSWEKTDYTYGEYGCEVTKTYARGNGDATYEEYTDTYYEHGSAWKELTEESSIKAVTDENGKKLTVVTYAQEEYCVYCSATISKKVNITTLDENSNIVKEEEQLYKTYANSEEDTGFRLYHLLVGEYGVDEYAEGEYRIYILSVITTDFADDGSISHYEGYKLKYLNDNHCEYVIYLVYQDGTEYEYGSGDNHDEVYEYRLHEGAESCTDGLDRWRVCRYCDYEYLYSENYTNSHYINSHKTERVNIPNYSEVCDGYVTIATCPCGERKEVNTYFDCEFESESDWEYPYTDECWEYYIVTYGCSVSHPVACGFVYVYESWTSIDPTTCVYTNHYRYTFGSTSDNPYVIEWSYNTGSTNHNREWLQIGDTVTTTEGDYTVSTTVLDYVCSRCGEVFRNQTAKSYYTADGEQEKNTVETKYYYADTDRVVSQIAYNEEGKITSKTGEYSTWVTKYSKDTHFAEDGVTQTSWAETVYDYSRCYNLPIRTTTYSDGEPYVSQTNSHDRYDSYVYGTTIVQPTCTTNGTIRYTCNWCGDTWEETRYAYGHSYEYLIDYKVTPTCTQDGIGIFKCYYCDDTQERVVSPFDHDYSYNRVTDKYHCNRCGLENFTGYDGRIVMEDLTAKLGNGENYVIGYWFTTNKFEYIITISIALSDDAEPIILNVTARDDGESLFYVSVADVKAAAEALGYNVCNTMIRFNMVPVGGETVFDFAVTLDPHVPVVKEVTVGGCNNKLNVTSCAFCNKILKVEEISRNCTFNGSRADYTDSLENSHNVYNYTCSTCGFAYQTDNWTTQEGTCIYYNHTMYSYNLLTDGSYQYVYEYVSLPQVSHRNARIYYIDNEDGTITRLYKCEYGCVIFEDKNCATLITNVEGDLEVREDGSTGANLYIKFVPTKSGKYKYYSSACNNDPYGYVYDANGYSLIGDDDSGNGYEFYIEYNFTAGTTYYLVVSRFREGDRCNLHLNYLGA